MNFKYVFMPALLATVLTVFPSCTKEGNSSNKGGDLTYEEAQNMQATFPELDSFMPEPDVPSQGKSAKRGVCTNFRISNMPELLGSGVTWCYNWSHNPLSEDRWAMLQSNGMVCLPMVWNAGFDEQSLATFLAHDPAANYVLAYNEPNLTDQANMTPAQAAEHWPDFVAAAKRLGLKIVGPAVNYGTLPGYGDPVTWYDEFLTYPGVSLDDIDAIALHCYMPNGNAVKTLMIRKFYKYNKPLWLTEFENGEAQSAAAQADFCQESVTYLEADPRVERYAWFMDNTGSDDRAPHFPLITLDQSNFGGEPSRITDIGRIYTGLSTFDKDHWYPVDVNIPAEHYTGQIIEETAQTDTWGPYVKTNVTDDVYGDLEISNLTGENWVEYNIDVPATSKYRIDLRYNSSIETTVQIDCEGCVSAVAVLPKSVADTYTWSTAGVEMALPAGHQTIRLSVPYGNLSLNWLRITSPVD